MKITQFEQSGLIIENTAGYTIAIDISAFTPLEKLEGIVVDAMLISHIHGDHFSIEHIKKLDPKKLFVNQECLEALGEEVLSSEIVLVSVGDTVAIDTSTVSFFDVDHGPNATLRPKENFGFLFTIDDQKIYFAGDMFYPSGIAVDELEVAIACIPVGTFYTFGPQEAVEFITQFKSIEKVIPMHYEKTPENREDFVQRAETKGFVVGGM